ncbi:hypothetical protein IKX12_03430 [Candidatus Saccharibacteria bacterium]|nr:hypothetical protein [Candidatus Saccharibacteria bacterium]
MAARILLDPMEIDFGNHISVIAGLIDRYHLEEDTEETIDYDDSNRKGYKIPLSYSDDEGDLSDYAFPNDTRGAADVCKELAGYLDWLDDDSVIFVDDGYLYVIK